MNAQSILNFAFLLFTSQPLLQHYGGGDFINKCLVSSLHFLQAHFHHGPLGVFGRVSFVDGLNGNGWKFLL